VLQDSGKQRITKYTAIRLQRKDYRLALEKEKFVSLTGSIEMLETMLFSGKKAPRNFVLRCLREQAKDVSPGDVQISEMDTSDTSMLSVDNVSCSLGDFKCTNFTGK